jgi:hypothetical protein
MDERIFHLRSRAVHAGDENDTVSLAMEIETDDGWSPVELGFQTPPYRAFLCSAVMCQQAYLRMNATERRLALAESHGDLRIVTVDWFVRELIAHFRVRLRHGAATGDDLGFISERMRDCPVSRNLHEAKKETTLEVI